MDLTALINTYRGPLIGLIASWGAPWADASRNRPGQLFRSLVESGIVPRRLERA